MTTSKQNPPTLAKSRKGLHPGVIVCFVLMGFVALLISSFLIWRFRLSSQMSARLSAIRNAGEPTTTRELDHYYAAVPEAENAAVVWMKGLEKLNPPYDKNQPTAWGKIKLPERGRRLGELQKASQILRDNEEAMKIFRTAARTSKSRYKVDLSGGPSVELPHLSAIKSAGSLLRLGALVAAQTGESDESAEAIRDVIGAAESLRAEPLLISQLVRFSLHSIAGLAAQSTLNLIPLQESKLAMLQKAFEEAEDKQSIYRALVGERACSATYLLHPDQVPLPALSADPQQDQKRAGGIKGLISPTMRMSGFFQRDGVFFLDAMATNLAVAQLPDPDRFKSRHAMDSLELKARKGYYIMS
ncbi:MAG: hypothetical protein JWM16_2586, partial [Verrucomicrobiales bacterium]|nr:hypothetical protein [Verrucomicrobiales bacterium]